MLTEAEASTKWCPFARCGNEAGCNRNGQGFDANPVCIGSNCMAWRWGPQEYEDGEPLPEGNTPADSSWEQDGTVWCAGGKFGRGESRVRWRRPLTRKGRCSALSPQERP